MCISPPIKIFRAIQDKELLPCDNTPRIDSLEPAGLSEEQALEWIFLLDTLNFCFWSDSEELFGVNYRGKLWTGYRSLCAALCKAVEVSASGVRRRGRRWWWQVRG